MAAFVCTQGVAEAGRVTNIVTATGNLTVKARATASISITPESNLQAGETSEGTRLATANIHATSGTIAYRWTPNLSTQQVSSTDSRSASLKPLDSSSSFSLPVIINDSVGAAKLMDNDGSSWMVTPDNTQSENLTILTVGNNNIPVGNYPMSIDAAIWIE